MAGQGSGWYEGDVHFISKDHIPLNGSPRTKGSEHVLIERKKAAKYFGNYCNKRFIIFTFIKKNSKKS